MTELQIGIDVGGTFTDLVAIDDAGRTTFAKSPSTPEDQSVGVLDGLAVLAERVGLDLPGLLAAATRIVHGTTVATNALLERKGACVALLTTEGHRDVLEMREGLKPDRYDLRTPPPAPLVPRRRRLPVRERIRADGGVGIPLDLSTVDAAIDAARAERADAIAICYLHAWRNPSHEIATEARLRAALPDVTIVRSSDVLPQIKEYERVSTTVVSAYVAPALRRYLTRLETRLAAAGYRGALFVILSHGGMAPVAEAVRLAAATVLSGPAGGIAGARRCAALLGIDDLVPFDMGGTSTDISLIAGGQAALSAERGLAGQRIALRSLDIASIGAGGGSIARLDDGGMLHVGPESAGAVPGPACYGADGTAATVTDANLLLGYLDPARFLGGRRRLDTAAAARAVDPLAAALGLTRETTAAGVVRLINQTMADGIRLMTVRRGVDPRRHALLAFGGAAGLHAVAVARALDITRVVVPTVASVLSAWGMLASDLRFEATRTHVGDHAAMDDDALRAVYAALEHEARGRLGLVGDVAIERSAEMRYGEQIFEIDVPLDGIDWDTPGLVARVGEAFHRRHETLYTYALRDEPVVFVNARAAAIGRVVPPGVPRPPAPPAPAVSTSRAAWFDGWRDVAVWQADTLAPGASLVGPAIIEAETTTVVLDPGSTLTVDPRGWLDIALHATG